jgi:Fe-S oxidoreductase
LLLCNLTFKIEIKQTKKEIFMKRVFAPGCALVIYKNDLAEKLHNILNKNIENMDRLDICCKNRPSLEDNTQVINVCPGCDRRYRENYPGSSTISLWEILAESDFFPFPDYHGKKMTIIDACPTRNRPGLTGAIRTLLKKMNIQPVEPNKATCCGDSLWGVLPVEKVKEKMIESAEKMPMEDVVVYCVSCSKSLFIGGKKPHYMVDLLLGEETSAGTFEPEEWHRELDEYIKNH